ncbi:DUF6082 family protein [Streptomyces sp. NPDC093088]|uniref:DUF6082 family protein n=1 Tax=Streptomyces sp. NPDC093088 TaxID=3366023 RepID=UPI003820EF37
MNTVTTARLAGIAVTGIGLARLVQEARHQRQRNETVVAGNRLDWLNAVSTNRGLAELWALEGMEVKKYMRLLHVNLHLCVLGLRDRLGMVSQENLRLYASMLMKNDVFLRYWARFGSIRVQEAAGDRRSKKFTKVLVAVFKAHAPEKTST